MIYKIRERWIYEDVEGLRFKFLTEKEALEKEALEEPAPAVFDWPEEEEEDIGSIA